MKKDNYAKSKRLNYDKINLKVLKNNYRNHSGVI